MKSTPLQDTPLSSYTLYTGSRNFCHSSRLWSPPHTLPVLPMNGLPSFQSLCYNAFILILLLLTDVPAGQLTVNRRLKRWRCTLHTVLQVHISGPLVLTTLHSSSAGTTEKRLPLNPTRTQLKKRSIIGSSTIISSCHSSGFLSHLYLCFRHFFSAPSYA